jgi:hypothetical protein
MLLLMNFQIYHNPVNLSYMPLQLIKLRNETKKRLRYLWVDEDLLLLMAA